MTNDVYIWIESEDFKFCFQKKATPFIWSSFEALSNWVFSAKVEKYLETLLIFNVLCQDKQESQ